MISPSRPTTWQQLSLPGGFLFGTASAAYQVEGAAEASGRTPSIWDLMGRMPGRIVDGSSGAHRIAHLDRLADDLALLADLGVDAHRFSLSWSRIQPTGTGAAAPDGLAFYDRLVDGLLAAGIAPWITLYHWDLPVELMAEHGGWLDRDIADRFADYAALVGDALGDRAAAWTTMSDPVLHMAYGHAAGIDAPGLTLLRGAFAVTHHLLLGHAKAREALRSNSSAPIGIANHHTTVRPASECPEDRRAALAYDIYHNRQFAEPLLAGRYPRLLASLVDESGVVRDGDLAAISEELDFYGVDYFHPITVSAAPGNPTVPFSLLPTDGLDRTDADWPIHPESLTAVLLELGRRYPRLPALFVTESGGAFGDTLTAAGTLADDERRIDYLDGHLAAVAAAIDAGADVRGFFHRSLTDGWEGTEGYTQQYGLVRIDPDTGDRIPRASFRHYRDLIAAHHSPR